MALIITSKEGTLIFYHKLTFKVCRAIHLPMLANASCKNVRIDITYLVASYKIKGTGYMINSTAAGTYDIKYDFK